MRILALSGFIPEQVCDTVRFTQYKGDRNIKNFCGYVSDYISQVLKDDSIDGAVYPRSCDSSRNITSYLSDTDKFHFQINVPVYNTEGAVEYFAASVRAYKEAVEGYYGIRIDDMDQRIDALDRRNALIRQQYEDLSGCSYSDYLESIHNMLQKPLFEQSREAEITGREETGKRVFLTGSFLSNTGIVRKIEEAGLTVAGDAFPESGRIASMKSDRVSSDPFIQTAASILSMRPSPTQNSFRTIIESDIEEIRRKDVKGVIYITQKYCEAYDYLYSVYKKAVEDAGLSILHISLNDTEDDMKAGLALEAFADII